MKFSYWYTTLVFVTTAKILQRDYTTRCRSCAPGSLNMHSRMQDHLHGTDCPKFCLPWLTQLTSEDS